MVDFFLLVRIFVELFGLEVHIIKLYLIIYFKNVFDYAHVNQYYIAKCIVVILEKNL